MSGSWHWTGITRMWSLLVTFTVISARMHMRKANKQLSPYDTQDCYKLNMTNCVTSHTNCEAWKQQVRICTMLKTHNPFVRPGILLTADGDDSTAPAVTIWSSLKLRSLSRISDAAMDFTAEFRLTQKWFDSRLAFNTDVQRFVDVVWLANDQKIWIPDTFFQNEKNGWYHKIDAPNRYIKIRSDGLVTYNTRLTLILSCLLDLRKYPMDVQKCHIDFSSYAYTTEDINYVWDERPVRAHENATKALPSFDVRSMTNETCNSKTTTGTYSCLRVEIIFVRVLSAFMLQLYIPSTLLVIVSWVSYWLDWQATAARIPLDVITLLAMITTANAANAKLPPVAYTKAMDVWIGACVLLIFFALMEYAFVQYVGLMANKNAAAAADADLRSEASGTGGRRHRLHNTGTQTVITCVQQAGITDQAGSPGSTPEPAPADKGKYGALLDTLVGGWPNTIIMSSSLRNRRRRQRERHTLQPVWMSSAEPGAAYNYNTYDTPVHFDVVERHARRRRGPNYRRHVAVQLLHWCDVLRSKNQAERIDIIARIAVPLIFVGFNVVYWLTYFVLL